MILWLIPLITAVNANILYGAYIHFNISELQIELSSDNKTITTTFYDDIYFGYGSTEETISYAERTFDIVLNESIPDNSTIEYSLYINEITYVITPTYFSMAYNVSSIVYIDLGNALITKEYYDEYTVYSGINYDRNISGTMPYNFDILLRAQLEQFFQYNEGFSDGYDEGYDEGYEQGERDGMNNANDLMTGIGNFLTGVFGALDAFLQTEIIPGLTLWSICLIPIGFGILTFFINLWR